MRTLLSLALLLTAQITAAHDRTPLRVLRRGVGAQNPAAAFTNTSTSDTAAASSQDLVFTPSLANCTGSVTYTGSVPPTVYLTVTEGYNVTVTASNVSITDPTTLITPLPACAATIVPHKSHVSLVPVATIASTIESTTVVTLNASSAATTSLPPPPAGGGKGHPLPEGASDSGAGVAPTKKPLTVPSVVIVVEESTVFSSATVFQSADFTSTVIVTKKTPVPVVAPTTSAPPVFQPSTTTPGSPNQNVGGKKTTSVSPGSPAAQGASPKPSANPSGGLVVADGPTTAVGNVVATAVNPPAPGPVTTTIDRVPVTVFPSSVGIGGQVVPIPASSQTTIQINGETFTVRQSEIVAAGTTFSIAPVQVNRATVAPTTITAAPGLLITVGGTTAVVGSTTFRIGQGSSPTTITVNGQTISIGPGGVGLAATTVAPGGAGAGSPFVPETAGGLTFSVDGSEAVISGTTYRIGAGAPETTAVIGGQTVSFGPGGVGFKTTTVHPTTATGAKTGSGSATGGAAPAASTIEGSAPLNAAVNTKGRIPIAELLGWLLFLITAITAGVQMI